MVRCDETNVVKEKVTLTKVVSRKVGLDEMRQMW